MSDLITSTLRSELLAVLDDPSYRPPPLPQVALELMVLSGRENTEVHQVVAVLERDQMLAATVLRLVGSPIYAGRARIRSLDEAVVRLGVRGVRDAVFQVALSQGVFSVRDYGDTLSTVLRHCTAAAYLTRVICRIAKIQNELAFLCALLHDVGFSSLLLAVSRMEGEGAPPLNQIWTDIDRLHEQASLLLCRQWGLPDEVTEVVGHHHHLHTGKFARLAAVVRLADHLAQRFGIMVLGPLVDGETLPGDALSPLDPEAACLDLEIDAATFEAIVVEGEKLVLETVWT